MAIRDDITIEYIRREIRYADAPQLMVPYLPNSERPGTLHDLYDALNDSPAYRMERAARRLGFYVGDSYAYVREWYPERLKGGPRRIGVLL